MKSASPLPPHPPRPLPNAPNLPPEGMNMHAPVTVNDRTYPWPKVPAIAICLDGCEPDIWRLPSPRA